MTDMDEKDFKKHLRDLAHGKHNPAEHDWSPDGGVGTAAAVKKSAKKPAGTARKHLPKRATARGRMP
ncbi:MAG: hypothetical protein LAP87_14560 [Acidobacteriia bacterium]|nr:hypothetical protein [Terriglobia bacterium]